MSGQDWLTPAAAPPPSSYEQLTASPGLRLPGHELRPLTLSEILDRTFTVYRSRFWLFSGIAACGGVVMLIFQIVQLWVQHGIRARPTQGAVAVSALISIVSLLVLFLVYGIQQAATVHALTAVYLGRPVTIGESMKSTKQHWFRYVVIAAWQYGSFIWLPFVLMVPAVIFAILLAGRSPLGITVAIVLGVLIGLPGAIVLGMRNLLAVHAAVDEHRKLRDAMRRSKQLAKGAKGRIFVVLLIWIVLYLVVGVVQSPMLFMVEAAIRRGGEAIVAQSVMLLVGFLGHAVVFPVGLIGLSLIYFDQRVRKEAFDLELLIGDTPAVPGAAATEWAAPVTYAPAPPAVEPVMPEPEATEPPPPDERSL